MTKLCPRGKAAAKRKFRVYPSAYANAYASKICAGKIKDPSGVKRKDFRGPKPSKAMGGRIYKANGGNIDRTNKYIDRINKFRSDEMRRKGPAIVPGAKEKGLLKSSKSGGAPRRGKDRRRMMGGGMTMMPRAMYKKGGKSFPDLSGDGKVTMKDILMGRGVIPRKGKKGGGLMEATSRLKAQGLKAGGVAKGCGAVMNDRRKVTKMY
jgi:hypothetical protein